MNIFIHSAKEKLSEDLRELEKQIEIKQTALDPQDTNFHLPMVTIDSSIIYVLLQHY